MLCFEKKILLRCFSCLAAAGVVLALGVSSCTHHRPLAATAPMEAALSPGADEFNSAVRAFRLGRPAEAGAALKRIRADYPGTLWAGRASFLSGVMAVENAEAGAGVLLDGAAGLKAVIPDYLAFYRARAYALDNEHEKAVHAFDSLIIEYPGSALVPEASFLRASSLMASGRTSVAAEGFEAFASSYHDSPLAPEALLKAAEARARLGMSELAAVLIKKVFTDYPADPAATGAEALLRLNAGEGGEPELTPAERYRRARRLFRNAHFEEAAAEYALLSADPEGGFYDKSVIQSAVAMVRLKRYDSARSILDAYMEAVPGRAVNKQREALYWSALVSLRQGDGQGLGLAVERLAEKHPRSTELARALIFLGRHYESQDMREEAVRAYKRVMEGFAGTSSAGEAAWNTGWMHYRAGRFEDAFRAFSPGTAPGAGERARSLYWSARSVENMGDPVRAARLYRGLCGSHARDYYCRMAEKRLAQLNAPEQADEAASGWTPASVEAPALEPGTPAAIAADPRYLAARELLALGLDSRAAGETALLAREYSEEPESLAELAGLFYRAGDFYRASNLYHSYLAGLDSGGLSMLSFPPRLVELVRRKSPPGPAVDPYLVAAVMREESSFNPDAVSSTGAMGLMQIMPSTGRYIASRLGRDLSDRRELLDPDINLELGSWYLGHLAGRFGNDIVLTIASYNAGPGAVARWAETLPSELDEFIESIPYPETRRYAKKVLKSYGEFLRSGGVDPSGFLGRPVLAPRERDKPSPSGIEAEAEGHDGRS